MRDKLEWAALLLLFVGLLGFVTAFPIYLIGETVLALVLAISFPILLALLVGLICLISALTN